jgi:predicted dehydrogenase
MAIGIIGTGWGARVQVPAFRSAGLAVTALAGRDPDKTARIAGELGVPFATGDWRALLARDDVALVSIVTPPDVHREMAEAALAAGKHVLCEKPTALDAGEAAAMLAAAQAHPDQLALIDHELRFLPGLLHARELIAAGAIGAVRFALGLLLGSGRADPNRPWQWWSDWTRGGGLVSALGSHQVDTLRYLLGAEVTSAAGSLATLIPVRPGPDGPRAVTADDTFSAALELTGGTHATLAGSAVLPVAEPEGLTLYGEEGALRWTGGRLLRAGRGGAFEDISPPHRHDLLAGLQGNFAHGTIYLGHALRAALAGERAALAPAATFVDGLRVQEVLDALRRSQAEGRAQRLHAPVL